MLTPAQITALGSKKRIPAYTENTTNASFTLNSNPVDTFTLVSGQFIRLDVRLLRGTAFPNNLIPVLTGSTTLTKLRAQASAALTFVTPVNAPQFIWKKDGIVQTSITGTAKNITLRGTYEVSIVLPCGSVSTNKVLIK